MLHAAADANNPAVTSSKYCWLSPLQVYPHQDSLSHVLAGLLLNHPGERLGEAVRRPGMMAAAAAWDPDAVPALCILTLAGDDMTPDLRRTPSRRPRQLLQPATLE